MQEEKNNSAELRKFFRNAIIFSFSFLFLFAGIKARAATLYLSPSSGSYEIGKTFSAVVFVSSADKAMNAASGVLAYPADKLEVTSISKSGSIFSLWAQEPSFGSGNVTFEGIVLNPGFKGSAGKIITINFKAKASGSAAINFSSGSVLANDGNGTNILTSFGGAGYLISSVAAGSAAEVSASAPTPAAAKSVVPPAPAVTSENCPDPSTWCNFSTPTLNWSLPPNIKGVSVIISDRPNSNPGPISDGMLSSYSRKLADGVWYLHVRLKNSFGWGPITHYKLQIDTTPPQPMVIDFPHGQETFDSRPIITFNTTDTLSGVDYYRVKINDGGYILLNPKEISSNPYALPEQEPGKKLVLVEAYDRAGNKTSAVESFYISAVVAPKISDYPKELSEGDLLEIKGQAEPNSHLDVYLKEAGSKMVSKISSRSWYLGYFEVTWPYRLNKGKYILSVQSVNIDGVKSELSPEIVITVTKKVYFKIGRFGFGLAEIIIALFSLATIFLTGCLIGVRFLISNRLRLKEKAIGVHNASYKIFNDLAKEVVKYQEKLGKTKTKRGQIKENKNLLMEFEEKLKESERVIHKEIDQMIKDK